MDLDAAVPRRVACWHQNCLLSDADEISDWQPVLDSLSDAVAVSHAEFEFHADTVPDVIAFSDTNTNALSESDAVANWIF